MRTTSRIPRRAALAALTALTALTLAPAVAGAQVTVLRRLSEQQQPVRIIINGKEVTGDNLAELLLTRRARLGVTVDMRAQPNDSIGATLEAVTPGGPAFKGGDPLLEHVVSGIHQPGLDIPQFAQGEEVGCVFGAVEDERGRAVNRHRAGVGGGVR